jgi:predicted TIM-barrel fold metal-dependent hydrolase
MSTFASTNEETNYLAALKTDFHKHIFSPDNAARYGKIFPLPVLTTGEEILKTLPNEKTKCFLLSDGYITSALFASGMFEEGDNEYDRVKSANNWAALQVAQNSDRLIGFASVDFLKPYAIEEIKRCHEQLKMPGLKLYFPLANGMKGFSWDSSTDVQKLQDVFLYASKHEMPVLIHHMNYATSNSAIEASNIIELAAKYPNLRLQIAHLGGGADNGSGGDFEYINSLVEAIKQHPKLQVYTDISAIIFDEDDVAMQYSLPVTKSSDLNNYAEAIRSIGLDKVLFGSDSPLFSLTSEYMTNLKKLPLTNEEFQKIYNQTPEKTLFKGIAKNKKVMAPTMEDLAKQGITLDNY